MASNITIAGLLRGQNLPELRFQEWGAFAAGFTVSTGFLIWYVWCCNTSKRDFEDDASAKAIATDPGLLRKHSTYETYDAAGFTYPSIRTVYHPHPQAAKLPTLPLLVFIHGLGGSVAQFAPMLTSMINVGPCLAIDFPGCGT